MHFLQTSILVAFRCFNLGVWESWPTSHRRANYFSLRIQCSPPPSSTSHCRRCFAPFCTLFAVPLFKVVACQCFRTCLPFIFFDGFTHLYCGFPSRTSLHASLMTLGSLMA